MAKLITIEANRDGPDFECQLSFEPRVKVMGRLPFPDGVPATTATSVTFESAGGYSEMTLIRPDGTFGLTIVRGREGTLRATTTAVHPVAL
jgi:hypothetical protein